ncbi:MAG: DUF1194 domain-containing protein [Alphaproteobacteria bacterium]|nr:DUF1194 domain-containing protein [Alphaproteobacteria bacterium]
MAAFGIVATAAPVDLELVLAVDVSRSIDEHEAALQRQGYVAALTDPRVIRAISQGEHQKIAICYIEWAGSHYQRVVVPWRLVTDAASAAAFVAELQQFPPLSANWTSISGAIDFSAALFGAAGHVGKRKVIDISGDGRNNHGRPVSEARAEALQKGITINGLPVINDRPNFSRPAERDLDIYYERQVIGGRDAFMVVADSFERFGEAILNKLIKEIAGLPAENLALAQPSLP